MYNTWSISGFCYVRGPSVYVWLSEYTPLPHLQNHSGSLPRSHPSQGSCRFTGEPSGSVAVYLRQSEAKLLTAPHESSPIKRTKKKKKKIPNKTSLGLSSGTGEESKNKTILPSSEEKTPPNVNENNIITHRFTTKFVVVTLLARYTYKYIIYKYTSGFLF